MSQYVFISNTGSSVTNEHYYMCLRKMSLKTKVQLLYKCKAK